VSAAAPSVLIADGTPASRMRLEPPLRRAGWNVVTVASSFEVLRTVRDHDVGILLIDPELPGAGVSGVDVVRTLKSAARFRQLPVFFLLRSGQGPPAGVMADGALDLDQIGADALLETIRKVLQPESQTADALDGATREGAARAAETAVARDGADEVRATVERIVREVAREVVPGVAERLIREEIRRLRQEHGLEEPPG